MENDAASEFKCGVCSFKTHDINAFIPHYRDKHYSDTIVMKMPYMDINTKKRKYSVLNYHKNIKDFGSGTLIFYDNFNLKCLSDCKKTKCKSFAECMSGGNIILITKSN